MRKYFVSVLLCVTISIFSQVKINEFVPKGSAEWVELYNAGASSVDLTGWKIYELEYPDTVDLTGRTIPAGGYDTLDVGYLVDNSGDILILVDDTGDTVDMVGVGYWGGAPMAPYDPLYSVSRITDGLDTDDDARDFTIDATPTPYAPNDAPGVNLGSSLIINEIRPYPTGGGDSVELYNPTGSPINVLNWLLCDGDYMEPIVLDASVPSYGYMVLESGTHFSANVNFSSTDVCYLFNTDTTRIDQLGWAGEYNDYSFQRIPDGTGPNDGYDWISSGGGVTLFDTFTTWGGPNSGIEENDIISGYEFIVPRIIMNELLIEYFIPEEVKINISLFDKLGRRIYLLIDKVQSEGYYRLRKNNLNLPDGIYFLFIETPGYKSIRKVVIFR